MNHAYILTLSCPDRMGIVHAVSGFLLQNGGNIEEAAQYNDHDTGLFFMRVQFACAQLTQEALKTRLEAFSAPFSMKWKLHSTEAAMRTVIMVSRDGHCLNDLLFRWKSGMVPLASPAFVREHGPFEAAEDLEGESLLRSPLEPWRTWFSAHKLDWPEPPDGSQFNDIGLMCDAAAAGMGIALIRLKLGAPWLENGSLVRLGSNAVFAGNVPSPHAHYLCWRTGTMDRWECAAFADWLRKSLG